MYGIRNASRKEVINCDTCQRTKQLNIKHSKLPANEAEKIPRNKLCVYIKKENKAKLTLRSVSTICRLIITQYNEKRAITIEKLVETTRLTRYTN